MNMRSVESRLAKLEGRQSVHGEYLLVWRNANEPEATAVGEHGARARKIICIEWSGEGPPPQPRWLKGGRYRDVSELERQSIERALRQLIARCSDEPTPDALWKDRFSQLADNELLYRVFGVAVQ